MSDQTQRDERSDMMASRTVTRLRHPSLFMSLTSIVFLIITEVFPCIGATQDGVWLLNFVAQRLTNLDYTTWQSDVTYDPCRSGWKYVTCNQYGKVIGLNLANQGLGGTLDPKIGLIANLEHLRLENNNIGGPIPELGQLLHLRVLDLSNNSLEGAVPASLAKLSKMVLLDLSKNRLTGEVPEKLLNLTKDCTSFQGNAGLCSDLCWTLPECSPGGHARSALYPSGPPPGRPSESPDEAAEMSGATLALGAFLLVAFLVLSIVGLIYTAILWLKPSWIDWLLHGSLHPATFAEVANKELGPLLPIRQPKFGGKRGRLRRFQLAEMQEATGSFSTLSQVGRGTCASVFCGVLSDGSTVAIKRFQPNCRRLTPGAFEDAMADLSRATHRHLAATEGICTEDGERIVVTAFLPTRLDQVLHGGGSGTLQKEALSWTARCRIAKGVAQGMASLHSLEPSILHGSLKMSNVLLDSNATPVITDFGLCQHPGLFPPGFFERVHDPTYHLPPEYFMTGHLTKNLDVFSFGAFLLELMLGRHLSSLISQMHKSDSSLGGWVARQLQGGLVGAILDPNMPGGLPDGGQVAEILQLVVECMSTEWKDRPTMSTCAARLEGQAR